MIAFRGVRKRAGKTEILRDCSLEIEPGTLVCIVGESGAGKTTMLRLLLREETPDGGGVEIDGVDLASLPPPVLRLLRARIGVIFQEPRLLSVLTCAENVRFPLDLRGVPISRAARDAAAMLERVDCKHIALAYPETLTASQRSLVAIARGLAGHPPIILVDDPFGMLDDAHRSHAIQLLIEAHERGSTVVAFTRATDVAAALGGRMLRLAGGKIEGGITPPARRSPEPARARLHAQSEDDAKTGKKVKITLINS